MAMYPSDAMSDNASCTPPNSAIGTLNCLRALAQPDGHRRQRHAAALGQAFHEHVPPEAASLLAAQYSIHGHPDILALDRAVHEGRVERAVPRAHLQLVVVSFK